MCVLFPCLELGNENYNCPLRLRSGAMGYYMESPKHSAWHMGSCHQMLFSMSQHVHLIKTMVSDMNHF
jgi:hypothetical protein